MRSATPSRLSSAARDRASASLTAPLWCLNAARVSEGMESHSAAMSYGPLIPATARSRGSNAALRAT